MNPSKEKSRVARGLKNAFRKYFLVGIIVLLPFFVTVKLLLFFITYLDSILEVTYGRFLYFIPERFHPDSVLRFHIPGWGLIFTVIIVCLVGILSRNYFGNLLIRFGDSIFAKIPLARTLYLSVKEIVNTYAVQDTARFTKVVLIEFPRSGCYTLGLVTGSPTREVQEKTQEQMINVFVATTPSPVNGFYLILPEREVIELNMSIEDAFKLIISAGLVKPGALAVPPP